MRAKFLHDRFKRTQFEVNVVSMLKELFTDDPSITRTFECSRCDLVEKTSLPVAEIHYDSFSNNISNIEDGILDNLLHNLDCKKCEDEVGLSYEYGNHMFVEIPSGDYTTENRSDFEHQVLYKLGDIPVSILDHRFTLVAAFLYSHGSFDSDIGHYTAAIKLNEKWEIFDDCASKTKEVSNNHKAVVHALMYVRDVAESESQDEYENETEKSQEEAENENEKEIDKSKKKGKRNLKRQRKENKEPSSQAKKPKNRK